MFAPNSTWRAAVVALAPGRRFGVAAQKAATVKKPKSKQGAAAILADGAPARPDLPEPPPLARGTSLGNGVVPRVGARIDWATLLRRVHLEDVLACPCGGRRRVLGDINEPGVAVAILKCLGLPTEAPPIARARSPAFESA